MPAKRITKAEYGALTAKWRDSYEIVGEFAFFNGRIPDFPVAGMPSLPDPHASARVRRIDIASRRGQPDRLSVKMIVRF